jgi:hypothetical protein
VWLRKGRGDHKALLGCVRDCRVSTLRRFSVSSDLFASHMLLFQIAVFLGAS